MSRKLLALLLPFLFVASIASARTRSATPRPDGATVHGVVTSVAGNIISIADGLVTIDATNARVIVGTGGDGEVADIEVGMLVFATVRAQNAAPNAPLPASTIAAARVADATFFGVVEDVNVAASTLTLLGRTIHVDDETSFGGIFTEMDPPLANVHPNQIIQVQANVENGQLLATSVLLISQVPPSVATTRGTVRTIGTDEWTIEEPDGDVETFVVNAQTRIAGSPKVGDRVEVLYRVDSSHANVAIAIARFDVPKIPEIARVHGVVQKIEPTSWTIGTTTVIVNGDTKIEPGLRVGDSVEALAQKKDDGTLVAAVIVKKRF
jgi:Cu/Ag efflux protein CusF